MHELLDAHLKRLDDRIADLAILTAGAVLLWLNTARDEESGGRFVGFAFLRPYHPLPSFLRAAEISCFLDPVYAGRGIGTRMLERIAAEAMRKGIDTILANVSSLNEASLRFHARRGFVECGRFKRVAKKKGRDLDAVWMQLTL